MKTIPVSKYEAIVDDEDYDKLVQFVWTCGKDLKPTTSLPDGPYSRKIVFMNRLLLNPSPDEYVIYINNNFFDNRKENLKIIAKNKSGIRRRARLGGTSKYKGVSWNTRKNAWRAGAYIDDIYTKIGYFDDEIEAAKTYDRIVRKHYGDTAAFNFPNEGEISAVCQEKVITNTPPPKKYKTKLEVFIANKLTTYKKASKHRKLPFNLSNELFAKLLFSNCYYCKIKPSMNCNTKLHPNATLKNKVPVKFPCNGIDRIDNTLGYEPNNVVPCCKTCNFAKNSQSFEDFKIWIIKIYHEFAEQYDTN